MKKLFITLSLCCCLIATILPTAAYAGTNDGIQDGPAKRSAAAAIYYKFSKTSQTNGDESAAVLKVSPDVTGKGSFKTSYSKSVSRTLNIGLNSAQESKVKASVSGSYGITLSSEVGVSIKKTKSKKGYLAFQPYRRVVKGKLKTYNSAYSHINGGLIQTQNITAKYPQKLPSGHADGHYYVKYY